MLVFSDTGDCPDKNVYIGGLKEVVEAYDRGEPAVTYK